MKKFLFIFVSLMLIFGLSSCNSCSKSIEESVETELVVENVVSMDKEDMFLNYGKDYRWYETCVLLKNFLDEEYVGITGVSNIFQVMNRIGDGYDVKVIMYSHVGDTTDVKVVPTFWIEDQPMNEITITFDKALELINEVNLPKPHSQHVVLRKEVGPIDANPQWIFGNQSSQIYVDAITGEVRDYNPVFPKDNQLNYAFSW